MKLKFPSWTIQTWCFIAMGAVGLYLRYAESAARVFWNDEITQIVYCSPAQAFWRHNLYGDMTTFPGDYVLTFPFLYTFGPDKWFIILPHIAMTLLGFYLMWRICIMFIPSFVGQMGAFAVYTFNTNLIFHAFEYRPYAVLPTLSLACFLGAYRIIFEQDKLTSIQKIGWSTVFVLTAWFHAYGLPIVVFTFLYHSLMKMLDTGITAFIQKFWKYFLVLSCIILPVWGWYAYVPGDPFGIRHGEIFNTFKYIPSPAEDFIGCMKAIFGNLIGQKILYVLLLGTVASFIIPHVQRWKHIIFFVVLIALPLTAICLASYMNNYLFLQRQFVWVMPLYALWTGMHWAVVDDYVRKKRVLP